METRSGTDASAAHCLGCIGCAIVTLPRAALDLAGQFETARFWMRSITIHDAFKDYDAVMSSREHLWARFGRIWG